MRRVILILALLAVAAPSAQSQTPDTVSLDRYAQEGQRALSERRYDDAARAFEKLRDLSPQTAEVHAQLGAVYFQQQAFAKAVPTLRQALKLKPGLPNVDVLLALCLSELGQFKEALPGLRKAFNQTTDLPLRRLGGLQLQRAYTGLEQDAKAVEVALELSRLYPDDPEVLYHGGRLFANFAYLQTIKLATVAPDSVWLHQAAGEANESQGLYDAALREYRQVLTIAPRRPGIHFRICGSTPDGCRFTQVGLVPGDGVGLLQPRAGRGGRGRKAARRRCRGISRLPIGRSAPIRRGS
jgi:tetratricopeptide (TPR) repeat protein